MDECQQELKKFSQFLFSISPTEITILGSIIGVLIAAPLDLREQRTIGNFIQLVSQAVLTYSAQLNGLIDISSPSVDSLQKQIDFLKEEINRCKKSSY